MGEQLPSILQANELSWFSTTGPPIQRFLYNLFFSLCLLFTFFFFYQDHRAVYGTGYLAIKLKIYLLALNLSYFRELQDRWILTEKLSIFELL